MMSVTALVRSDALAHHVQLAVRAPLGFESRGILDAALHELLGHLLGR